MLKTIPFDILWKIQKEFTITDIKIIDPRTVVITTEEEGVGNLVKKCLENPLMRINSDASYEEWKMGNLIPTSFDNKEITFKGRIWK